MRSCLPIASSICRSEKSPLFPAGVYRFYVLVVLSVPSASSRKLRTDWLLLSCSCITKKNHATELRALSSYQYWRTSRKRLRDLDRAHAALDGLSISGDHCVPWVHYHPQIERLSFGPPQVPTALKFMDSAHWVRFLLALTCWVFMRPHGLDGGQVGP